MRISVNLASRPFVELRPFFLRLRILMGVLVLVAVGLVITAHSLQKNLDRAQVQMNRLVNRTVAMQQEKQNNERRMHQPVNAAVLDRSHFLNAVFLRKSFSWTAVMMDLETVLPVGVQVTSIEPQPTAEGDVIIRLRVSGDRDKAILLVRNLERSKRFLAPHLNSENSQAKEGNGAPMPAGVTPGVEFEILANYNPLPEGQTYTKSKAAKGSSDASDSKTSGGGAATHAKPHTVKPGPHDGVVLKPYVAPRPSTGQPAHPLTPQQGGAR
jgi:type IV pilus assembly protein PilN